MYMRQQMISYIKELPTGTRIAVFTLASRLRLVQGFTSDSAVLLAAIDGKKHKNLPQPSMFLESGDEIATSTLLGPQTALAQSAIQAFDSDVQAFEQDFRVRMTLQALEQIGRYLSGVPGRKNLIWFSGSFPLSIDPDPDALNPFETMRNYGEEVQKASQSLTVGRVAVYPIDARGLLTQPMFDARNSGSQYVRSPAAFNNELLKFNNETAAAHATMQLIADETGGKAIYNTNDLKDALARVIDNGSNYYTLAYTPTNTKWDGSFRHIKVLMDKSGYVLEYRRGYYADDPYAPSRGHAITAPAPPSESEFIGSPSTAFPISHRSSTRRKLTQQGCSLPLELRSPAKQRH